MKTVLRFDDALAAAFTWAREHKDVLGGEVHLVRDIFGHIRVVPGREADIAATLADDLHRRLGQFSPGGESILIERTFFETEELCQDRTLLGSGVFLIDRLVSEQGWRRAPVATPNHRPRIVFFGVKGGVGRSTALVALAKQLSDAGRRVLVVDMDLESPGTTSMLLQSDELPRYGVVDWFVEEAVGQADEDLCKDMVAASRLGEVLVVPAVGARSMPFPADELSDREETSGAALQTLRDGSFVAKLGRAYASSDGADFGARVEHMLMALERSHQPDVVLLDSRAGMHDISAAVVPRLGGTVLLFAGATSQTWLAYRLLFSAWRRDRATVARFRDRLRIVASLVPETARGAYLERIRDNAFDLFSDFIYDTPLQDEDESIDPEGEDVFNFGVNSPDAPHVPLPIYWRRELVEWEPAARPEPAILNAPEPLTPEQFNAAFGPFLRGVLALPYVADIIEPDEVP
jgi:hypothetical protein